VHNYSDAITELPSELHAGHSEEGGHAHVSRYIMY